MWESRSRSHHLIDSILHLLLSVAEGVETPAFNEIWGFLLGIPEADIVRPSMLADRFGLNGAKTKAIVTKALEAGLVAPIFRLNTNDDVVDFGNDWQPDPSMLKREFSLVRGGTINGSRPENIEVAFRKFR